MAYPSYYFAPTSSSTSSTSCGDLPSFAGSSSPSSCPCSGGDSGGGDDNYSDPGPSADFGAGASAGGIWAGSSSTSSSSETCSDGGGDYSAYPIRYANGETRQVQPGLRSGGYGIDWGHTLSYSNQLDSDYLGLNGYRWFVRELPQLGKDGSGNIAVIGIINDAIWFNKSGSAYVARFFSLETLVEQGTGVDNEFVFTDTGGRVTRFYGFDANIAAAMRGQLKSFTDSYGHTHTSSYVGSSSVTSLTIGSSPGISYNYDYYTSGDNAGRLQYVTLKQGSTNVRRIEYDYYAIGETYGGQGDLKRATLRQWNGSTWDDLGKTLYRYYTSNSSSGFQHGLKYVVGPQAYARLLAAGYTPETEDDSVIANYADHYFEFNGLSDKRVTKERVNGPGYVSDSGTSSSTTTLEQGYAYSTSSHSDGYNNWKTKTVETLPDSNTQTVWTNYAGQVMFKRFRDVGNSLEWYDYFKYDTQGRVSQRASSEAIQSYVDSPTSSPGLVTLNSSAGLIRVYNYYGTSSPGAPTALVTGVTLNSPQLRSDFTGWVGFKFTVGSTPIRVTDLGRWVVSGNSGSHVVKLVRADDLTDVPNASATVNTSGKPAGQFAYAQLAGTVTLAANTTYYLVSHEVSGGDQWYNYPGCGISLSSVATLVGPGWSYDSPTYYYWANTQESYVPVSLKYAPDSFAPNRLQYEKVKQGDSGTEIKARELQYLERTVDSTKIYPVWREILYRSDSGGGSTPVETTYDYLWFAGTFQVQERTTIWPVVGSGQNGSGKAERRVERFDEYGRLIWIKDERGFLTRLKYDDPSGGLIQRIDDVDVNQIGDSPSVPTGWTTPSGGGLHLVTAYTVDNLGRPTEERGPSHSVDLNGTSTSLRQVHWTVYKCAVGEVREASGYIDSNNNVVLIEPITVTKEDYSRRTTDVIVTKRAAGVSGALTATEDVSDQTLWVRWTKQRYINNQWSPNSTQVYYSIPSSGEGNATNNYNRAVVGFDSRGRQVRSKTPGGTITRWVRNMRGWVTQRWVGTDDTDATDSNPAGSGAPNNMVKVEEYQYDSGNDKKNGNLTQVTRYEDGSNSRTTSYLYDFRNRRTRMTGEINTREDYTYDNLDRLTQVDQIDDGASRLIGRSQTNYDDRGRVYERLTYAVNPSTGATGNSLKDDVWYDPSGNVLLRKSPGSSTLNKMSYDGVGRVKKRYVSCNTSTPNYSSAGTVSNDTVMRQEELTYDAASNVIQQTVRERFHDATGTGELQNPTTSPKARVSYVALYPDALGREQASANYGTNGAASFSRSATIPARSDTVLVNSTAYNARGEAYQATDPKGTVVQSTFDDAGRLTQKIEDYGTGKLNRETDFTYNADGRLATLTAVNGDTGDQVTQYLYGATLTESYLASNDLLRSVIYPDSSDTDTTGTDQVKFEYNRLAEVKKKTLQKHSGDAGATVHEYVYDKLGRLQHDRVTAFGDNIDQTVKRVSRTYEVRGMLEKATSYDNATVGSGNVVNEVQFAYNDFSQLTTEYQEHGGAVNTSTSPKVQYAYTDGSANHTRPTSLTYPDSRVISYDYGTSNGTDDLLSRIVSIKQSTTVLAGYSYLGVASPVRVNYSGEPGVELTYIKQGGEGTGDAGDQYTGLDRFGRLVDQRWLKTSDGTHRERVQYGFDRASNVQWRDNLVAAGGQDEYYTYDGLYQLKTLKRGDLNAGKTDISGTPTWEEDFTYDPTGNWHGATTGYLTKVSGSTTLDQNRTHNEANEITGISGTPDWADPTHDAAGNMTSVPQPASLTSSYDCKYDAWNRLVQVKSGATTVATYRYDGQNRRVTKLIGSDTRHYYYSARWQVLEERLNTSTSADRQFVWGLRHVDDLIERDYSSTRLYALHDHLSLTAVISTAGAVQERYGYDGFGTRRVMDASFGSRGSSSYAWEIAFAAYRLDTETGLYQIRNRFLHPKLGRWITQDPSQYEDATNLYLFARNQPSGFSDSYGLQTVPAPGEPGSGDKPKKKPPVLEKPKKTKKIKISCDAAGTMTKAQAKVKCDVDVSRVCTVGISCDYSLQGPDCRVECTACFITCGFTF